MFAGALLDPDIWSLGRLEVADAIAQRARLSLALQSGRCIVKECCNDNGKAVLDDLGHRLRRADLPAPKL